MKPDVPRPLANAVSAVRRTILAAGECGPVAGSAGRELGRLLLLVKNSPLIEAAAARVLAACIDIDEEIDFVGRCRTPPAHSVENGQIAALFALQELSAMLNEAIPSREAYHLGLAWAFRFSGGETSESAVLA